MDPPSQFLTGPRAQAAFTLRVVMDPPFAIDVRDEAAVTVIVVVRGNAWITAEQGAPRLLQPGQAATVRGPAPYLIADTPERTPTVVIDAGQSCRTPAGEHLELTMFQGVRTWGNSGHGETVMLIGSYQSAAAAGQLATAALPPLAVFTAAEADPVLRGLLERELTGPGPGQESALDRILDLLLLHLVRVCVDRAGSVAPSWAAGTRDRIVATALALLHQEPAAPWTVGELARRAHVSRATMAARFHTAVGQPPMTYLTAWHWRPTGWPPAPPPPPPSPKRSATATPSLSARPSPGPTAPARPATGVPRTACPLPGQDADRPSYRDSFPEQGTQ